MPLRIVRASSSTALWDACLESFLRSLGSHTGPAPHAARLWVAHRTQRDATLEAAAVAGLPGWFDPPIHFLSELQQLFGITARPIGLLTGRLLIARLAREHGERLGMNWQGDDSGPARSHMLDALFGDLLAEGVEAHDLRAAVTALGDEEFTRRRNDWVVETYAGLRTALDEEDLYDSRQIHALAAGQIEAGRLPEAVRGAHTLHVYGITSLRQRHRLFRAFADQQDVDVVVYLLREPEASEWEALNSEIQDLDGISGDAPSIQPLPDARREAEYVAHCVKRLLVEDRCRPKDIAIVARSGREDTRRIHRTLLESGIPSTARLRSTLAEVPALRALLDLFGAQARGWDFRGIRANVRTPYFGDPLDPAVLDFLASERRISGLDAWRDSVDDLARIAGAGGDEWPARRLRGLGLYEARIEATRERLAALDEAVRPMAEQRSESEWIELTRQITGGSGFGFRERICRVVGDRYDIVRLDQRAVSLLDSLLHEWKGLVRGSARFPASEWHDRLRRLLQANELALTTPVQEGVQILEAHEAALTPFPHLFLVHANDGEFPRSARGGGVFSERERSVLRRAGLPLEDRVLGLRRERSLWRAVTAGPSVTVTYQTASGGGVPLLPSLMVPNNDAASSESGMETGQDEQAAINPVEQRIHDVRQVVRERRGGQETTVPVVDAHAVRHAVVGAFAEELRAGSLDEVPDIRCALGLQREQSRPVSECAHAYAGWLRDPVVTAYLAESFGSDYVWSASQLEQYAVRPFDFFLRRILRINDRSEAEDETGPLASGSVVHAVLESLHRRHLESETEEFAEIAGSLDEVCSIVFDGIEKDADLWLGDPSIWRLKREHIQDMIRKFVAWDMQNLRRLKARPISVEHEFGSAESPPVRLEGLDANGDPADLLLSGRIDRVDGTESGGLRIVDYKLSSPPSRGRLKDGALLQSALYLKAWECMNGTPVSEALFLSVKHPGKGSKSGLPAEDVDEVLKFALSIPSRVRAGLFEPIQARSVSSISSWQAGIDVTRTDQVLGSGNRFESAAEGEPSHG
jgi:hypothetical protein